MEAGDCPPLNINAMRAISVKSYLKSFMTQGASKLTSRHKNLMKGANRFFHSTAKKIVPTKLEFLTAKRMFHYDGYLPLLGYYRSFLCFF